MNAIEFSSRIEKGKIVFPKKYKDFDNEEVRVILLVNDSKTSLSKKEAILKTLNKMKKEKMFSVIQDPVLWQKGIRNEWE